jgi:hypothetical protein
LQILIRQAESRQPQARRSAMESLLERGDEGAAALAKVLETHFARLAAQLDRLGKGAWIQTLRKRVETDLPPLRQAALAFIADTRRFTKSPGSATDLDQLLAPVRELYLRPATTLAVTEPPIVALLEELDPLWLLARAVGTEPPAELRDQTAVLTTLDRIVVVGGTVGIGRSQVDRDADVAAWNRIAPLAASAAERRVFQLTTQHRLMLGLPDLEYDERLRMAAHLHSREMCELGYFSHSSPTPGKSSPTDRARLQGYGGGCGENIAGHRDPDGAFRAWLTSPGHHRNIVGRHAQLGVGFHDSKGRSNFTMLLGNGDSLRSGSLRDPRLQFLSRKQALAADDVNGWRGLMRFCEKSALQAEAVETAYQVLALKPGDSEAEKLLVRVRRE